MAFAPNRFYVQRDIAPFFMLLVALMATIVESKFLTFMSSMQFAQVKGPLGYNLFPKYLPDTSNRG